MSNTIKTVAALGLVALLAACGGSSSPAVEEEIVFVDPAPVAPEPVFNSKYR